MLPSAACTTTNALVLKVPGDPLDDVADDARYGIYTFIATTEKPRELVIAEDLRQLPNKAI